MSATYPLDQLGILASNKVKNEVHTLHPVSAGEFNFIVPRAAPFFGSGVVVKYFTGDIPATEEELENVQATRLVHGTDYLLTHRVDAPEELTEEALYASISLIDIELEGNVILQYRTIGSDLVVDELQTAQMLATKTVDPRSVYWNEVIQDIEFPPSAHLDDAETLYGMEALIAALREIQIAIAGGTNFDHFHEITQINGLADSLASLAPNTGPNKYNVGPHFHFVMQSAPFEIVLPDFDSDVHVNVKLGLVGSEGRSIVNIHADIPKSSEANEVIEGSVAYFEDDYLSGQAKGHLVYRHADGLMRMAIDIGTIENVMAFIAGVSVNTPNARVYTDGWAINDNVTGAPEAILKDLNVQTGGGLQLDFAKTGEIKANTAWMVLSNDGDFIRTLPDSAPDNAIILVKDHGDNAHANRATISGKIAYAGNKTVEGLYLDKQRGWVKFQFKKHKGDGPVTDTDNAWHVVSGA